MDPVAEAGWRWQHFGMAATILVWGLILLIVGGLGSLIAVGNALFVVHSARHLHRTVSRRKRLEPGEDAGPGNGTAG